MSQFKIEPLEVRMLMAAQLVLDINPGFSGSSIQNLQAIGSTVYFSANNGSIGEELWTTSGSGATPIEIRPGANGSNPGFVFDAGGVRWFGADNGTLRPLWRLSGTTATPTNALQADSAVELAGKVYFLGYDNNNVSFGHELFRMDPSGQNIELVKDIRPGPSSSFGSSLTRAGSSLVFIGTSDVNGDELFVSNGTPEPATDNNNTRFFDIFPGAASSSPQAGSEPPSKIEVVGNLAYLSAIVPNAGRELTVVNTASGSALTLDLNPGAGDSNPNHMLVVGSTVFLTAFNGTAQTPWAVNGSSAVQLLGSNSGSFAAVVNTVFFSSGRHLY
jgi:ELWxxDGT repeat protein